MPRKSLTAVDQKEPLLLLGSQMTTGGAQRVLLNLAGWLHQHGYPVTAAFFYDKDGLHQRWQQGAAFPIHDLQGWQAGGGLRGLLRLPGGLWRLYRLMRRSHCRAVLTYTHHSNLLGIPLAWLAGVPLRIASHHGSIHGFPRWQERLHAWMINTGMATRLVAVSEGVRLQAVAEGVAEDLSKYAGIPLQRIRTIYNPVIPIDLPSRMNEAVQHPWFSPGEPPVILGVGRLVEQKNFTLLMHAFHLALNHVEARLVILGEGEQRSMLESLASQMGIQERVSLPGFVENPYAYMHRASLFVLSSRWEGLPTVVVEALACGCPVVSTDCPYGPAEILANGKYGVLVPPNDVDALADAIVEALTGKRKISVEPAWLDQFRTETVVQKYLEAMGLE